MHSHLAKMIGQCILDKRKKLGVTQKSLAKDLEISAQFLGRIEKGEVMIPDPALRKVIQILDLSQTKIVNIYRAAAGISAQSLFEKPSKKARRA